MRAARLLREAAGVEAGARIVLDKRIPVAAGLGGGSSDAAATLLGLNRLWGLRWRRERLMALAVRLGMDVPFFLGRGRALGTGRGEVLSALPGVGGYALVLVNPGVRLSTQEVYGRVPPGWRAEPDGTKRMLDALKTRNVARVAASADESPRALGRAGHAGDRPDEGGAPRRGRARRGHVGQRADRVRPGAIAGPGEADPASREPRRVVGLGRENELRRSHPHGIEQVRDRADEEAAWRDMCEARCDSHMMLERARRRRDEARNWGSAGAMSRPPQINWGVVQR